METIAAIGIAQPVSYGSHCALGERMMSGKEVKSKNEKIKNKIRKTLFRNENR